MTLSARHILMTHHLDLTLRWRCNSIIYKVLRVSFDVLVEDVQYLYVRRRSDVVSTLFLRLRRINATGKLSYMTDHIITSSQCHIMSCRWGKCIDMLEYYR